MRCLSIGCTYGRQNYCDTCKAFSIENCTCRLDTTDFPSGNYTFDIGFPLLCSGDLGWSYWQSFFHLSFNIDLVTKSFLNIFITSFQRMSVNNNNSER